MSDLQKQKNQKIEPTHNQLHPRDARGEDFEIGSVSRTDAEYAEAKKDSEAVRQGRK
jgi:hypothetical protein